MKEKTYYLLTAVSIFLMLLAFVSQLLIGNVVTRTLCGLSIVSAILFMCFGIVYIKEGK